MWNWFNCYLSGRHDFGVTCASGSIFLRCIHCGKRSNGWAVHREQRAAQAVQGFADSAPLTPGGATARIAPCLSNVLPRNN